MNVSAETDAAWRFIQEEASFPCLTLDRSARITAANPFARRQIDPAMVGKAFGEILLNLQSTFQVEDALNRGTMLLNVHGASGRPQTFTFHFKAIGNTILVIGQTDQAEMDNLRLSLIDVNQELSNLQRELQKKNAELVKLNDVKNQFLGMAAHDLRNPIGIIQVYSDFLLDEAGDRLSDEHIQFLKTIHRSSDFMLNLLNDLLDIVKIESGKLDLHPEPTDLVTLVSQNVTLNRTLADKKDIRIHYEHYETLPPVLLDPMKIEQVMNNLISNAIKFSPAGKTITVKTFRGGDHVTLAVQDEGPGIPEEERQKLFQPFSKTSVKSTGGEKSTGLGLSIVRRIVIGHRGKIWVESTVGKGSTFYFSLPLEPPG